MFGELVLNNMNKKRTTKIITKEENYFSVLSKKIYDSYLKMAQLYFKEGLIFKGIYARYIFK